MNKLVVFLFIALFVLHHDFWNWDNRGLVFGFIPAGLAYHAAFSLAAATLWLFTIRFAWPAEIEAWAEGEGETKP
ncbi:hypothetical protein BH23VER1_BH23VER1_28970 [soil metagenome]